VQSHTLSVVGETDQQRQFRQEALVLSEIGKHLTAAELPRVEVRIPRALAEKAIAAWEREDDQGPLDPENSEQRVQRHRAATLALIGLSIANEGRWEGDEAIVALSPEFIGIAIDVSDYVPPKTAT
jgi:hypothetical protein